MPSEQIGKVISSATFRLALIYAVVFSASVVVLAAFIYWSTVAYMTNQTEETIRADIEGLAERYKTDGLVGLTEQIAERLSEQPPGDSSIYLLANEKFQPLLGNLDRWPRVQPEQGWVNFRLGEDMEGHTHFAMAQTFVIRGRLHLLAGRDVFELTELKRVFVGTILWGLAITIALAIFGGIMTGRSVMRRLETINRTSREIMSGDLSLRVPTTGSFDEYDRLAHNLNNMLDQIEVLMEGVKQISDNIAHDLKTPLARLRNSLESLRLDYADQQSEDIDRIDNALKEADGLLETFNALLRIARIESKQRRSEFSTVELKDLASDIVELYEPLAEERRLDFELTVNHSIEVRGDRHLLFQAIANLVDNALKYTPENGKVAIQLDQAGVSVSDTGPGIPEPEREKVLQRFYRLDRSRTSPGSGLGLSLVRAVAALHDAKLTLSDNQPGLIARLSFSPGV